MARHRSSTKALLRRLSASVQPVYVLDHRRRIVYCNSACASWLGVKAEQLYGQRCDYHSQPLEDKLAEIAAGLCPPPEVFQGVRARGEISAVRETGQETIQETTQETRPIARRLAEFTPLCDGESSYVGAVAIGGARDIPTLAESVTAPTDAEDSAQQLHLRLADFRRRLAKCYRFDWLAGESAAIRQVHAQAKLAVHGWSRTVIAGPPGSGRERLARAIHYSRSDPPGPLAPLDCSLIDPELMQQAITDFHRRTMEEQAEDKSTLLLLNIDQLSIQSQHELAGFLLLPRFDLHIIATAQSRLIESAESNEINDLSAEHTFLGELALALSTLVIEIPSLGSRKEDIPLVVQTAVEEINAEGGLQFTGLTADAVDRLMGYHWPGDLCELIEIVREAAASAQPPLIDSADLPPKIRYAEDAAASLPPPEETIVLDEFLAEIEEELIRRALKKTGGNKSRAARMLGVTRPRLHRRLSQQTAPEQPAPPPPTPPPAHDDDEPVVFDEV